MMIQYLLLATMLFISLVLFATYRSAAGPRKNLRMGISLPYICLNHPEVLALIRLYTKKITVIFIVFTIAMLPVVFIKYTSFLLLYLSMWLLIYYITSSHVFDLYQSRLILQKSRNRWFQGECDYHLLTKESIIKRYHKGTALLRRLLPSPMEKLLSDAKEPVYVDSDEYWINGYYYNPNDRKIWVEKRFGAGTTVNMATGKGRFITYASLVFMVLFMGAMISMFLRMDFISFEMNIKDTSVAIDAPVYSYEFLVEDMEAVELLSSMPEDGIRTNGAGTQTYDLGHFRYEEYGDSMVFVYRDAPAYIVIKLKEKTVFFNTKNEEETRKYYKQLLDLLD